MQWISERDLAEPGMRLFCLPHAGSGAAGFYRWKREIARGVSVCPVMLPGREMRLGEPLMLRVSAIAKALHAEVRGELTDRPYAIYGHSMSALLAFEWARLIEQEGLPAPQVLFVAGRDAPQTTVGHRLFHRMNDEEMVASLVEKYGGDAAVVLQDEDLRQVFLPILRADLEVVETYTFLPGALHCELRAYAGISDKSVSDDGLMRWSEVTSGKFAGKRLDGDHFFHLGEGQRALLREIAEALGIEG